MDTTKEYIKMCEKAEEIQKEYIEPLDFLWSKKNRQLLVHTQGEWKPPLKPMKHLVWLPRQHQLQDMIGDFKKQKDFMLMFFSPISFYKPNNVDLNNIKIKPGQAIPVSKVKKLSTYWPSFKSWEQLWLAFVMKEKYGKIWDGDKWTSQPNKN